MVICKLVSGAVGLTSMFTEGNFPANQAIR